MQHHIEAFLNNITKRTQTMIAKHLPNETSTAQSFGVIMSKESQQEHINYLNARIEALESHVKDLESTTRTSSLKHTTQGELNQTTIY